MRILYDTLIDSGVTLTASTEDGNFPVANIQDPRLSLPWRSEDDDAEYIVIDAGSGNTLNPTCVAIAGHNLTDGCTLKIQGHTADSWATPDVDQTITHRDGVIVHFFTGSAKRYWRLYIDDDSNPDGYVQIGRVMLGAYVQMPPVEPGVNLPVDTTSVAFTSITGQVYGDEGVIVRVPGFQFPLVTETQRQALLTMWGAVHNITPFVLVVWEDSLTVEGPLYCRLDQDSLPFELAREAGVMWSTTLKFREVF